MIYVLVNFEERMVLLFSFVGKFNSVCFGKQETPLGNNGLFEMSLAPMFGPYMKRNGGVRTTVSQSTLIPQMAIYKKFLWTYF